MKCEHETATPFWGNDGTATVFVCVASGCGAIGVRSVGPANDADASRIEILAAEVGQSPSVWARYQDCDREIDRTLDDMGVRGTFGLGAGSPRGAHLDLDPPAQWTPRDVEDYLAGWLAVRQAESHLEKDEGYDWEVTRPIAEQWPIVSAIVHDPSCDTRTDAAFPCNCGARMEDPEPDPTCPACGEAPEACTAGAKSDVEGNASTAALIADLDAQGPAYHAINDAFDAMDDEHDEDDEDDARWAVEHPDLVTFADGEVTPEQAEATRDHLRDCEPCGKEFVETVTLGAQLSTLPPIDDRFGHASDDPPEPPMPRCEKDGAMLVDGECTVCKWNGTVEA